MLGNKRTKFWTFVSLVFSVFFIIYVVKNIKEVDNLIRAVGVAGPLVSILLYGILAPTPITTDPLTVINGALFGPVFGIIISWLGNNFAALIEYYLGAHLSNITNFKESKDKLPFGLSKLPVASPWFLIFGRLIPGYGGKLISIMGGIYHVPVNLYLWTTAVTNLTGSILLALGGHGLSLIKPF